MKLEDISVSAEQYQSGLHLKQAPQKKLRVLLFTSHLGGGGAEMHLLRVANCLDRECFDVAVAVARAGGAYEPALAKDIQLYVLPTGSIASSSLRIIRAVRPLRALIQQWQPEVVCSVMDHANIALLLACRGLKAKPKIVVSVQNPVSLSYKRTYHPLSRIIKRLITLLYPQADRVVALTQGVAQDLGAIAPSLQGRVTVIGNAGMDTRLLQLMQEPLTERPAKPLIVAVGRLTWQKGLPDLIEAFAQLKTQMDAHLWLVGEGKQRPLLQQQIKKHRLEQDVTLLGFQENPFKYMAAADLFVLSSLYEGFGNVIVEAMACGTPVVATNCPYGPAEIITHGENGLLVPPANPAELAQAMLTVLQDKDLSHRLGQNGRERARAFSAAKIANEFGNLFLQLHNAA